MDLGRSVERAPADTGLDACGAAVWIARDALHERQVDHEPTVADRRPRGIVVAATHRDEQAVRPGKVHGATYVGGVNAPGDESGTAVDHAVPDTAGVVVAGRTRLKQSAAQ